MAKKTIETPVEGYTGLVAGVHFVDGKGTTDDEAAIAYFERQGYKVGGHVDEDAERAYPLGDPSDKWKKDELLAYATERSIDLGDAKTKDEIWGAIKPGGTPYKGVTTPDGKALVNDSTGDPSDKWKKDELLAYATERSIDLGDAKTKDEIWGAIKPGGTPYKGVTTPDGKALVNDSTDPADGEIKDQADLPVK